ncbi:hypothetical protein FHU28_001197 [Micromonospora echinospora]|uniref:Uncharacterized protein n=1 Tax=Micromonospora echinospora TaxID=1877 RepID=A0ABR6M7J7_MICEC|nr:hypothetical protein [Micromonospora echinospora]
MSSQPGAWLAKRTVLGNKPAPSNRILKHHYMLSPHAHWSTTTRTKNRPDRSSQC